MAEDEKKGPNEARPDPAGPEERPESSARRKWLNRALIGAGVVAGSSVLAPVVGFLVAPVFEHPRMKWQNVGRLTDFEVGKTVKVTFENLSPVPWSGVVGRAAAWVRRAAQNDFTAFSINCTHLGCPVRWLPGARLFMCPCHGGVYYSDGKVAAGPPPKPLPQYRVRVRSGLVQIRTRPLPITTTL